MKEEDLSVFIDGATHYFNQMSANPATVLTPYLKDNDEAIVHEYTGIIGISGYRKGCVYFSAPKKLLVNLLHNLQESDTSHNAICDLVGEVANTISGNARSYFGSEFMISVPVVVDGQPSNIKLPTDLRSYVIPVVWNNHEASVVISLE